MFELEHQALLEQGHEVVTYHVKNSSVLGCGQLRAKIRTALNAADNRTSEKEILEFLEHEQPDIGHVHNWFPLLSPSIYTAHQRQRIPVVQTLHNYRLGCAAATYRRNGKACTQCTPQKNSAALRHRCYNNSLLGSFAWKHMIDRNWRSGRFTDAVDHYICPSQEVYKRHLKMGLPKEHMSVLPNACPDPLKNQPSPTRGLKLQVSFVGRLVPEKGAHILLKAWQQLSAPTKAKAQLNIIGDGPGRERLEQLASDDPSICFQGALDHTHTLQHLCQSDLLVCPSIWAEPFGLTIIEAMAASLPVIASKLGGPAQIVLDEHNGYLIAPEDVTALTRRIDELLTYPNKSKAMGQAGRAIYESSYTPQAHAQNLTDCFTSVSQNYRYDAPATKIH